MNRKVVFIMSAPHAGSTLLDLILGSHTTAFSLGELASISPGKSACGICADTCSFWGDRVPQQAIDTYFCWKSRPHGPIRRLWSRYGSHRFNLYQNLFDASGASVLVDSSKEPWWVRRQLRPARFWKNTEPYLLYLFRDGRAVVNSLLRKYPERDAAAESSRWLKQTTQREQLFNAFPAHRRLKVTYDRLTSSPEEVTQSLCRLVDIDYEPGMLHYWKHDHHLVSGNRGTRSLIFRYREQFCGEAPRYLSERRREYYDQVGLAIRPDLRWQIELKDTHRTVFEQIAGEENRRLSRSDV